MDTFTLSVIKNHINLQWREPLSSGTHTYPITFNTCLTCSASSYYSGYCAITINNNDFFVSNSKGNNTYTLFLGY